MEKSGFCLQFDDVVIDRRAMLVTKGGARVELEPKAFDVLVHLATRGGQLVTKSELIADVWKDVAVTDHVLTRVIGQLRKGLGDAAREARYIETVPTRGYRFIAPLNEQAVEMPGTAPGRVTTQPLAGLWPVALVVPLVLLVFVGGGAWLWARQAAAPKEDWGVVAGVARQLTFASATLDAYPDFSPDGKLIAYASSASGAFEIEVRALTPDARPVRVTNDRGGNVQPDWSPDGQYLAYHSATAGGIWVAPALGGVPRRIAPIGAAPAWAPDGREIVFQTGEPSTVESGGTPPPSQLLIVAAGGGTPRPLTRRGHPAGAHTEPTWSPDGRRVAFLVRGLARAEVWTVGRDGGEPEFVWSCTSACSRAAYEPGGQGLILSVRGRGYLRVPVDQVRGTTTGPPRVLVTQHADFPGHIAISPDGRSAVYTDMRVSSNLYAMPIGRDGAAGPARALTGEAGRMMTPVISPDGRRVAFAARRESTQICLISIDGGEVTPLPVPAGFAGFARPGWVGNRVLGMAFSPTRTVAMEINPASSETREIRPIGDNDVEGNAQFLAVSFFADGRRVAFSREMPDAVAIYVLDLDTGVTTRVSPMGHDATFPTPSPDGHSIVYEGVADGNMYPMVVPVTGGAPRQLAHGRGLTWPHSWSADSTRFFAAIRRGNAWSLASIDATTGETAVLTTEPVAHAYLRYPAVSPTGDRVVYERTEVTGNIWQIALWPDASSGTR